ncbi:MAG: DUF3500 domain-containing protein [Sphingobacteriaceae bacterium]|nr:MAG: DUF3500 domain-containing protein [Sphingobacteriaceae bacterium]
MKTRIIYLLMAALSFSAVLPACKKTETSTSTSATVTALNCSSATFSGTPVIATAFTGTATVLYTGGSGVAYTAGTAISSTGVTGLTATLQAGTLAIGAGSLTYTIAGTPATSGTATFPITFGGQTCSFALTVNAASSGGTTTTGCSTQTTTAAKVLCAVQAFQATLTTTQLAGVQFDYSKTNAIKWSNLPCGSQCRIGLQFSTLTATQLAAAKAVVVAATGTTVNEGYDEINQLLLADDLLGTTAGSGYGAGNYFISLLGTPSATGTWQLQFGGHHLAVNQTYSNGVVTGSTPSFRGVEPTSWTSGTTTYTPMGQEKSAMADMLASFTSAQLATAKISSTFSDVVLGPGSDGKFPTTKVGIAGSALTTTQQAAVITAMKPWIMDTDDATAATILATYTNELANTYISYASNSTGTAGNASSFFTTNTDYVRIDGPHVWIEFVCQTGVIYRTQIHYHSIWRDHTSDYGGNFTF